MVRFSLHKSLLLPGIEIFVCSFSDFEGFGEFLASEFTCGKETSIGFGFDRMWSSDFAFIIPSVSELGVELHVRTVFDFCMEAVSLSGFGVKDMASTGSCFEAVTISEFSPEVGTVSEMFKIISLFEFSFFGSSLTLGVEEGTSIDDEWVTSLDMGAEARAMHITGITLEKEFDTRAKSENKLSIN